MLRSQAHFHIRELDLAAVVIMATVLGQLPISISVVGKTLPIAVVDLVVLAATIGLAVRHRGLNLPRQRDFYFAFFFVVAGMVSLLWSPDPFRGMFELKVFAVSWWIRYLVLQVQPTKEGPVSLAFILAPIILVIPILITLSRGEIPLQELINHRSALSSFVGHSNAVAQFWAALAPITLSIAISEDSILKRSMAGVGFVTSVLGVLLTASRGALLALLAGLFMFFVIGRRRLKSSHWTIIPVLFIIIGLTGHSMGITTPVAKRLYEVVGIARLVRPPVHVKTEKAPQKVSTIPQVVSTKSSQADTGVNGQGQAAHQDAANTGVTKEASAPQREKQPNHQEQGQVVTQAKPRVTGAQMNVLARFDLLSVAWQAFLTSPIMGAGFGSFGYFYAELGRFGFYMERVTDPHNIFALLLAEGGIVGLFLWGLAILSVLRSGWASLGAGRFIGVGAFTAGLTILVHALVEPIRSQSAMAFLMLLLTLPATLERSSAERVTR